MAIHSKGGWGSTSFMTHGLSVSLGYHFYNLFSRVGFSIGIGKHTGELAVIETPFSDGRYGFLRDG